MAVNDGNFDPSRNVADDNYNQSFNPSSTDLKSQEEQAADPETTKSNLKDQEAKGSGKWITKTTSKRSSQSSSTKRRKLRGSLRNKSAFGFIFVLLFIGIGYSSILAPNLILVNIKDLFTNDLADATTALGRYSIKMIDHKLGPGKADCADPETITCKLTTMSRAQVLEFKKRDFTVVGSKVTEDNLDDNDTSNDKPESRWKVQSVVFPNGQTASGGEEFKKIASSSDKMLHLANSVWNPRSSFFMDARYSQRIKEQFDLDKRVVNYGDSEDEVDAAFDAAMQGEDEKIDQSGQGAYSLKTLASAEKQTGFTQNAETIATAPNSFTSAQCAVYTQGKVVSNGIKRAKEVSLARFAMQYLKAADEIKSPSVSREIPANILSGKLAWSNDGGYAGKNATDAAMYKHVVLDEPVTRPDYGHIYNADTFDSIGVLGVVTAQMAATAAATKAITGAPGMLLLAPGDTVSDPREYCLHGQTTASKSNLKPSQCPALAAAAGASPLFIPAIPGLTAAAALGSRTCPQPPQGQWVMIPSVKLASASIVPVAAAALNAAVGIWADRTAQNFTHDTKGLAASDAIFTGTGIILGDMAMSRGMRPASKESLQKYLALKTEDDILYERIARYDAQQRPFDIHNKYSFLGSLVRSIDTTTSATTSTAFAAIGNILTIIPTSIAKITTNVGAIYNLQPSPLNTDRLQCSDLEYLAIGIEADMGCNVRYSMSKQEMDASVKDAVDYMLEAHPDESKNNIENLQQRLGRTDSEGDAADVNRQLQEAQEASNKPFIDKKTGKAIKFSEYEKYLTYCVNRKDPWGRTAMVVRRENKLSDQEKQDRYESKSQNGEQILDDGQGSEYEQRYVTSYMSVTEGADADQDWYTGKKCLDERSEMLRNFRVFTMACSVDGSFAGSIDCTEPDRHEKYTKENYDYLTSNDILYLAQ